MLGTSLAIIFFGLLGTSFATYQPHLYVIQSSSELIHRHSLQEDNSLLNRAATHALVARMAGGIETTAQDKLPPLPSRDVLNQPNLVVTIVAEGEFTLLDAGKFSDVGEVVSTFQLAETQQNSLDLEIVSVVAGSAMTKGKKEESHYMLTAANGPRQQQPKDAGSVVSLHSQSPEIVATRGSDEDVVRRVAIFFPKSTTLGATILRVPIYANDKEGSHEAAVETVALDIGRSVDRAFLQELDLLAFETLSVARKEICQRTTNVVLALTKLSALSTSQRWSPRTTRYMTTTSIRAVLNGWSTLKCPVAEAEADSEEGSTTRSMISIVIDGVVPAPAAAGSSIVEQSNNNVTSKGRRLLEEENVVVRETAIPPPKGARYFTQSEIATYQIKLGVGFIFGIALLLSVCLFCGSTMDYTTDSLLFSQISFKNHAE